jgi:hypothetical protein
LFDRIAQCRVPFIAQDLTTGALTRLNGAADHAAEMAACPVRFVLADELTRLCTALVYSKGASQLAFADLLRIPAERVWMEWSDAAWLDELKRYGFRIPARGREVPGRRGALVRAARDGRSGSIRTFWTVGETEADVLASSVEAYFDLDTAEGAEPAAPDELQRSACASEGVADLPDILRRYFRFRYERSWAQYYENARLPAPGQAALARHALGTIAADIPMMLAFFLLLSTRSGLPRRVHSLDKLNRARARSGKTPLLEHIEVCAPLLGEQDGDGVGDSPAIRRAPRLHHVRGHLVRRGSLLFWRLPHLRGSARCGVIRSRTVTWTLDQPATPAARSAQPSRI